MTRALYSTRDDDAWAVDDLDAAAARIAAGPVFADWPGPGPAVLDVHHDRVGTFLATRTVVTRVHLAGDPWPGREEAPMPPVGYTSLAKHEKRAVLVDGEVVRLWARGEDEEPWTPVRVPDAREHLHVLVPPDRERAQLLRLSLGTAIGPVLRTAAELSRRMRTALVVGRLVDVWDWH